MNKGPGSRKSVKVDDRLAVRLSLRKNISAWKKRGGRHKVNDVDAKKKKT